MGPPFPPCLGGGATMTARTQHSAHRIGLLGLAFAGVLVALSAGCENQLASGCRDDSVCAAGEACIDSTCQPAGEVCSIDDDCGPNATCRDGRCVDGLDPAEGEGEGEGEPTGEGTVRLTPDTEVDFGSPALGVAIERVVSVLNLGGGTFELTGLTFGDTTSDEFSYTTERPLPAVLEVGDRIEVTLLYTLADGEDDVGDVTFHTTAAECDPACDDAANIPMALLSEFKGARNLLVTPDLHDFGYVPPQTTSTPYSMLITNDGTIDKVLTVTAIDVTGDTDSFDFELPTLPLYLSPGQSEEVPVAYGTPRASWRRRSRPTRWSSIRPSSSSRSSPSATPPSSRRCCATTAACPSA
jgi:hypothetical protein